MSMKQDPRSEREPDPDADPNELQFDRFARSAGASLRSEAPEDGMTALVRQGNRQKSRRLAIEIVAVVALLLGGITVLRRSDDNKPNFNTPPVSTPETTQPISPDDPRVGQWFLDYTGNPAGPASGEPVKFGVAMQVFAYRFALDSAVKYLNEQAGGVGGRPIVLDVCGQSLTECADRFAADPAVVAVLENLWAGSKVDAEFNDSIGVALAGRKPLHTTYSNSGTAGISYYPSFRETAVAMTLQAEKLTTPGAKVLVVAGTTAAPDISGFEDRDVVVVQAGSESLVDTIGRAHATDAAAVVLDAPPFAIAHVHVPNGGLLCDDLSKALDELGMGAAVITDTCEPHEGWYKLDTSFNETSPDLQSGALPITTKMHGVGTTTAGPATRDVREAGALLAVIRVINQLGGPAKASPDALDRAMRGFTGPVPVGAGQLDCTPSGKVAERVQPGSCVQFVDVHQFVDGRWIDQPPVDLRT
jgi:hypothetical protein